MMTRVCDAHCHFFSSRFLELLTRGVSGLPEHGRAAAVAARLGWNDPGEPAALADVWAAELDKHGVARAALIASLPGDEDSVATAVSRHPARFVGFFMFDPTAESAAARLDHAVRELRLRAVALFPAMHHYRLEDERVEAVFDAARGAGAAVFVHCGVLSVGVRAKLGLPSPFDVRLGDPLAAARMALRFPSVPVIVPHFGAGLLREALMAGDVAPNIHLDTSSSNRWMRYHARLTLDAVFRQALDVLGPQRLLFGTDSSFFPRGWQQGLHAAQVDALRAAGASGEEIAAVLGGNFDRLFPAGPASALQPS